MSNRRATPPNRDERVDAGRERHAHGHGHGDGAGGVDDVVDAPQRQRHLPKSGVAAVGPALLDGEAERATARASLDGANVGVLREAIGRRAVTHRQSATDRVIGAQHLRAGDLSQVPIEALDERFERAVVVEEVDLHVEHQRARQGQLDMRGVALVGLDDQPLASRPVPAGTCVVDVAADDEARSHPRFRQHQHEHRGRRRLAVRARHAERPGACADRRQHSGPPQDRDPEALRLLPLHVRRRDRRRDGHRVTSLDEGRVVADMDVDACRPYPIERGLFPQIAAGDLVAHLGEHDRDGAHPRSRRRRSRGAAAAPRGRSEEWAWRWVGPRSRRTIRLRGELGWSHAVHRRASAPAVDRVVER